MTRLEKMIAQRLSAAVELIADARKLAANGDDQQRADDLTELAGRAQTLAIRNGAPQRVDEDPALIAIRDVGQAIGLDIGLDAAALYEQLTEDERERFADFEGTHQRYRLAKLLTVTVGNSGRVERQFGAPVNTPEQKRNAREAKRLERVRLRPSN